MTMAGAGQIAAMPLAEQAPCQLNADFQIIIQKVGVNTIGDCVTDELLGAPGDRFQSTTRGLLIFNANGNWTAFTDGQTTWINNPNGLVSVGNSQPSSMPTAQPSTPA